jgi:hypothetical protein
MLFFERNRPESWKIRINFKIAFQKQAYFLGTKSFCPDVFLRVK